MDDATVVIESSSGRTRCVMAGEIDVANSSEMVVRVADAFRAGTDLDIELDFADVTFLDSSGLSMLVALASQARARGGQMGVVGTRPPVRRVVELAGLGDLLAPAPA